MFKLKIPAWSDGLSATENLVFVQSRRIQVQLPDAEVVQRTVDLEFNTVELSVFGRVKITAKLKLWVGAFDASPTQTQAEIVFTVPDFGSDEERLTRREVATVTAIERLVTACGAVLVHAG